MKNLFFAVTVFLTLSAEARPLNCIVSFMDGSKLQDFVAAKTSLSSGDHTQYALVDKNGFSFYINEYRSNVPSAEVLSMTIVDNENDKTHLGTSPVLQKGQRSCMTIELGKNINGESIKVAISCEAL